MYFPADYAGPEYGITPAIRDKLRPVLTAQLWRRRKELSADFAKSVLQYKYLDFKPTSPLSMKKVRDLLVDSRLYLSAASDFNDPWDFSAYIEFVADPVARRKYLYESASRILAKHPGMFPKLSGRKRKLDELVRRVTDRYAKDPEYLVKAFSARRDEYGIACFSEDPRNLLMWSHYAAGHSGVCLQFDIVRDPGVLMLGNRVNYQNAFPRLVWPTDKDKIVNDVLLRKGDLWASEKEMRYISLHLVRDSIDFDGRAVRGVILGARFQPKHEDQLRELLEEREARKLPAPRIYRARTKQDQYAVFLQRVDSKTFK